MQHLTDRAATDLALSKAERIARVRRARWIGYTRAKQVLDKLSDLISHPKTHRMPNLLLVGETNNGKTMIVNRFEGQHPGVENAEGDHTVLPVLVVQAPPVPDEGRLYNAILERLYAPFKSSSRLDRKASQVISLLRLVDLKVLVIDEIHHILAGNTLRQRHFLNVIKYLGNELQIPIVGVGTQDAFNAIQTDPQLANRFEPAVLPRWSMGDEYLRLLTSFERMLPLAKPSNLAADGTALKLLALTDGILGELSALLTRAAVRAIETGTESITPKLIDTIGWVAPGDRRRQAVST